jgi:hypothetical protein
MVEEVRSASQPVAQPTSLIEELSINEWLLIIEIKCYNYLIAKFPIFEWYKLTLFNIQLFFPLKLTLFNRYFFHF